MWLRVELAEFEGSSKYYITFVEHYIVTFLSITLGFPLGTHLSRYSEVIFHLFSESNRSPSFIKPLWIILHVRRAEP